FWSSAEAVTGTSFQKREPSVLMATVTGGTLSGGGLLDSVASGSLTTTLCVIRGAVIMKMISSTSITSTSGVTLMSAIGPPPELLELKAMVFYLVAWLSA